MNIIEDDTQNMDKLLNEKNNLITKKYKFIQYVKDIENQIKEQEFKIAKFCSNTNNGHKWITEREDGPYGERFTYCERCRVDYYGNYFH